MLWEMYAIYSRRTFILSIRSMLYIAPSWSACVAATVGDGVDFHLRWREVEHAACVVRESVGAIDLLSADVEVAFVKVLLVPWCSPLYKLVELLGKVFLKSSSASSSFGFLMVSLVVLRWDISHVLEYVL